MLEAIRDRSTLMMSGIFLVVQTVLVLISVGPALQDHTVDGLSKAGFLMAFYLLFVGLMPATPAIGIASGVFAGDKERGCLTPLLVTPASNTAILAGKVLGAVLPALAYAAIGILVYFAEIALLFGPDKLALLPVGLSILIVLLIPGIVLFGTALASVISSRVRTFQSAQTSSFILVVLWIGLFGVLFPSRHSRTLGVRRCSSWCLYGCHSVHCAERNHMETRRGHGKAVVPEDAPALGTDFGQR